MPEHYNPPHLQRDWYIPHHSTGNKFRVVFDCSARCGGNSLNEHLLQGPDFTNNLTGVLIRFRQDYVAFTCDINAMYHQVLVETNVCNSLQFLWYPNNDLNAELIAYQIMVHLFGALSSPSCASYALRQTVLDNGTGANDLTVRTVLRNFYVDDCLCAAGTADEALLLIRQLCELLQGSGFRLSKFHSSCRRVLFSVPGCDRVDNNELVNIDCEDQPMSKTLGILWNAEEDIIQIRVNISSRPTTRRGMLSVISQVFVPFGMLSPFVFPARCLLQQLCTLNLAWDEDIPQPQRAKWCAWLDQLPCLQTVSFPRCYKAENVHVQELQLHTFCDACELGYGAVSYLRIISVTNEIHCSFVMSKSRVAPQRLRTIPRLELSAAVLGVQLSKFIQREMDLPIHTVFFWTDSTAVLQFINNTQKRFNTFVANRLLKIHNGSSPDQWHYVNTFHNPADVLSRGETPSAADQHPMWFRGPPFLWQTAVHWPISPLIPPLLENNAELKESIKLNVAQVTNLKEARNQNFLIDLCDRYSSWFRLQKAVAWLLRLKAYCKARYLLKQQYTCLQALQSSELDMATNEIIKSVQREVFSEQMQDLLQKCTDSDVVPALTKKQLRKREAWKPLQRLSPFLSQGILRVGGRIQRSCFPNEMKHPAILPPRNHVTRLLIEHYHNEEGHSGTNHTLATIRQKFWIVGGQSAVRSVIHNCIKCRIQFAKRGEQLMAPLPSCWLTSGKPPFYFTGVDYMGPLFVKCGRSTPKRYVCVFTCMSIHAVHLEISNSLDTNSFLQAFSRFIARRSKPSEVWSDNGSNFVEQTENYVMQCNN